MIRVMTPMIDGPGGFMERTFDDELVPKVLQSGALKIVRLVEVDIPEFDTNDKPGDMIKQPEIVVAVFNGEYIMERVDEKD